MTGPLAHLVPRLEAELEIHLMSLKFLGLFGERCRVGFREVGDDWASTVAFDSELFAWDRQTYPDADEVVLVDGNAPVLIGELLDKLPSRRRVLKSSDPRVFPLFETKPELNLVRRFLWYSTVNPLPGSTLGVREVLGPDSVFETLMKDNGYTAEELADFRRRGARGYLAESEGNPQAFCLVYPNHGAVWELGSLKTLPAARRRGFGSRVVRAAVNSILAKQHRVRYHVDAENLASRALAESLGLVAMVEARHYL